MQAAELAPWPKWGGAWRGAPSGGEADWVFSDPVLTVPIMPL